MSQWYAIRSATCREKTAAKALEEAGVTVFMPMETVERWGHQPGQPGRVRVHVERPLITGYLFVLIEPGEEAQQVVLNADGVYDFLGWSDGDGVTHPLPIPLGLILELQADERAGRYDRTRAVKPKYRPHKGDKVKAVAGPWLGWFGKVLATPRGERAQVRFEGPHGRGATVQVSHLTRVA